MKARLIKRGEIKNRQEQKDSSNLSTPPKQKSVTGIVRDWVGQHKKVKPSARQAFAALFAEPEMRSAD